MPSIAQVFVSGMPVVIDWLKPVIEPPPIKLSDAPSVIENGLWAMNAARLLPANESGSVSGVPNTVSSSVPGVFVGLAPCTFAASAQN